MRVRELARRYGRILIAAGVLLVGLVVFVLVWFQPQQLFIERTIEETFPPGGQRTAEEQETADDTPTSPATRTSVAAGGDFRSITHDTSGRALLVRLADGSHVARLEDLNTDNGPDLRVYLSSAPASAEGREYAEDFVDLGALRGNRGDQNYTVPSNVDVSRFRSVVIWCRRFTVAFGSAPLA